MIARVHRFHGYNALRHVYGRGRTVRGNWLAVRFVRNPRRSSYRLAVVVSRKVHKSAVVRNRIRRRIYEIIRRQESRITQPYDIAVLVYQQELATMPAEQLERAVLEQLERTGILDQLPA